MAERRRQKQFGVVQLMTERELSIACSYLEQLDVMLSRSNPPHAAIIRRLVKQLTGGDKTEALQRAHDAALEAALRS
jgi:hypothetical protein